MRVNSETVTLTRADVIAIARHFTPNSTMAPDAFALATTLQRLAQAFKGRAIDPPSDGNSLG